MQMICRRSSIPASEWSGGWRPLVAAACGVGTTWHFFQIVSGLFIIPMQAEFGWSRSQVAIGPIVGLISIMFYPFAGVLIDRYGPRRIALWGLTLLCVGFLLFSVVPANRIVFLGIMALFALIGSIGNQMVFAKGLATWFVRRFGTAIGIMMTGVTVTTAIGIPFLARVIAHSGWRAGFITLALIVAVLGIPINVLWFRARPKHLATAADVSTPPVGVSVREAVRDKRFWLVAAAIGSAAIPIGGFLTHLQPLLIGRGVSALTAASFGSVFVIAIGAGRLVVGSLLDRLYAPFVAAGSLCLSGLGVVLLASLSLHNNPWPVLALAISMIGLAQGAESDYISYFTLRIFGVQNFSKLVGILSMFVGAGMAIGGFVFAAIFDYSKDYHLAVRGSAILFFTAALAFLTLKVPRLPPDVAADMPNLATALPNRTG